MGERQVLLPAEIGVTLRDLLAPQHLRAGVRLPAGDDDRGRRTTRLPVPLARDAQNVVVDVDVEGRQREEVGVGAAAERRNVGLAQRLADVDVLAR